MLRKCQLRVESLKARVEIPRATRSNESMNEEKLK